MKKSVYRIILMVAGLLHLVIFFLAPVLQGSELMSDLSGLAEMAGEAVGLPSNMTGFTAVMSDIPAMGPLAAVAFIPPVVLGLLIVLMNAIGKGKLSYVGTLIFSILNDVIYVAQYLLLLTLSAATMGMGYKIGFGIYLCFVLTLVEFVVSIVGMVKDKGEAGAGAKAKSVKAGKKDGIISGETGSYAGAQIPVKSGDTVVIGRDPSICSIVIKGEKVSRKHCTVAFNKDNGMYAVTDYSSNGTFDGSGNRLARTVTTPMMAGSTIRIGEGGDTFRLG